MKKKNLNNLSLNKKSVSNLNTVSGGAASSLTIIYSYFQCDDIIRTSRGADCDIYSIGHDDGSICLSREADWCHGQ